jgi:uncharacterized phage protein (TIGR01671 family)
MREIKFRQWIPKAKKFHYFGFLCCKKNPFFKSPVTFMFDCEQYREKYPVLQYSGIKDLKGVEIYEGDVVRSKDGLLHEVVFSKKAAKFCIQSYRMNPYKEMTKRVYSILSCEVIGNIYENPELLGGSDE